MSDDLAAAVADLSEAADCLACGLTIDGHQDYCASCWMDVMDWLGF